VLVTKRKAKGTEQVALNLRIYASIVEGLDAIVAERRKADPFTPVTRTDVVRESLIRTIREHREAAK
jgi:hypothetical protein